MTSTLLTVFRKEIRDSLRDRRTIAMILVASIVTGPIVLLMLSHFISSLNDKSEARKIYVSGRSNAPTAINSFLRQGADVFDAQDDYVAQVRDGKFDAVIAFDEDFEVDLRSGNAGTVTLYYDDSRPEAGPAIAYARSLVSALGYETGALRLLARGVSPEIVRPIHVENVNLATPKQRAATFLFLIPMTTLILCITGGMAVAIDSTAGERERGSLEPLLLNPVRIEYLVLGKWSAVATYSSSVVMLAVGGYVVTLLYLPLKLDLPLNFGWREFALFAVVAIPLAGFMGSVLMLIATFGRSYKEAQTYSSYLITVASFVPAITIFTSLKDGQWQLFVPVLGANMVFMRILRGEFVGAEHFVLPALLSVTGIIICLALVSRLLNREEIVFGRS